MNRASRVSKASQPPRASSDPALWHGHPFGSAQGRLGRDAHGLEARATKEIFRTGAVFRRGTWAYCVSTPSAQEVSGRHDVGASGWEFAENGGCPKYLWFEISAVPGNPLHGRPRCRLLDERHAVLQVDRHQLHRNIVLAAFLHVHTLGVPHIRRGAPGVMSLP